MLLVDQVPSDDSCKRLNRPYSFSPASNIPECRVNIEVGGSLYGCGEEVKSAGLQGPACCKRLQKRRLMW